MLVSGGLRFSPFPLSDYLSWFRAIFIEFEIGGFDQDIHMYNVYIHTNFKYDMFTFDYGIYFNLIRFDKVLKETTMDSDELIQRLIAAHNHLVS
jgi:hypothetical protein